MYGMVNIPEEEYRRLRNVADELIRAYAAATYNSGAVDWETVDAIHGLAEVALGADVADAIRAEVATDYGDAP